jgi:hypothetical protein
VPEPLFVNASLGNIQLEAGSPMIDAGICHADDPAIPIDDFEGTPRPNPLGPDPAKCDIGADEF